MSSFHSACLVGRPGKRGLSRKKLSMHNSDKKREEFPPLATAGSAPLLFEAFGSIFFLPLSNSLAVAPPTHSTTSSLLPRPSFTSCFFSRPLLTSTLILSYPPFTPLFTTLGRPLENDNFRRGKRPSSSFLLHHPSPSLLVLSPSSLFFFYLTSPLALVSWSRFVPRPALLLLLRNFYFSSSLLSLSFLLVHNLQPLPLVVVVPACHHRPATAPSPPLLRTFNQALL